MPPASPARGGSSERRQRRRRHAPLRAVGFAGGLGRARRLGARALGRASSRRRHRRRRGPVRVRGAPADHHAVGAAVPGGRDGFAVARAPLLRHLGHEAILLRGFGVDDLHLADQGAQTESLEVKLDHREQVLVVCAVPVAVQVGAVLVPVVVGQLVSAQLIRHAVRAGGKSHDFRAPGVHGQQLQDVPPAVITPSLRDVNRLENLDSSTSGVRVGAFKKTTRRDVVASVARSVFPFSFFECACSVPRRRGFTFRLRAVLLRATRRTRRTRPDRLERRRAVLLGAPRA